MSWLQVHDGQWSIRPHGLFVQRELIIVDDHAGAPIGVFIWKDKTLTLTNQRVYHWQTTYTTPAIHEDMWLGTRDEPLLRYIPQGRLAKTARMTLPPKAANSADIPLLAPLGWYLYLMDVGPRL